MKIILHLVLLIVISYNSHAALTDYGNYTSDNVSGLDWLDLSETDNMALADAQIAFPEYTLATKTQFQQLISQFYTQSPDTFEGITGLLNWNDDGTTLSSGEPGIEYSNNEWYNLMGFTETSTPWNYTSQLSQGLYSFEGGHGWGGVFDINYIDMVPDQDYINVSYNTVTPVVYNGEAIFNSGIFFVRSNQVSVPEPSVFALMGIGLLGFGASRRKQKKN